MNHDKTCELDSYERSIGYKAALDLNVSKCIVLAGCLTDEGVKRFQDDPVFKGFAFKMDVTNPDDIKKVVQLVEEKTKDEDGKFLFLLRVAVVVN